MTATLRGALACDWAPAIEATARTIAAVIAAVYVTGLLAGTWIHRLNDRLAQAAAGRRPAVAPIEPSRHLPPLPAVALPCAPAAEPRRPAAVAAPALDQLTVAQLRSLARTRGHRGSRVRDARRSDLLRMLA